MGEKENYTKELITSILGILILLVLIFGTSYAVSVKESDVKINTLTMGYLSFNFTEGNNNTIDIVNVLGISDSEGINSSNYYEFSVSNDYDKSINYEILLEPIINELDGKYIKFYLTDDDNKVIKGFENRSVTLSELADSEIDSNKVLYKDELKAKTSKKFRLRVWLSNEYESNNNVSFSFKADVKGTVK